MFQFKGRGGKESVFLVPQASHYISLIPFPTQTHTAQIQTFQFRRILGKKKKKKEVVRVMRKRRTSQSAYTFIIFPQREVLIPHHTEAAAVPVHIYRGKKLNHLNSNNFQIKPKWVMRYSYPIGEDWGGNTAQRVLRS